MVQSLPVKPTVEFIPTPVGGPKPPTKVLSKHYIARRRRRIAAGLLIPAAIGCIAWFVFLKDPTPRHAASQLAAASGTSENEVHAEPVAAAVRPVYRHSVVPGGVRSVQELEYVIERDRVVAAHYQGINPLLMRNEHLHQPLLAHVSYRIGDKVYWTKKPVQLPKNEPVMTDGTRMIRERCGNLISLEPLAPVSDEEPALPSFDLPMTPLEFAWMRLDYTPPGLPAKPRPGQPSLLTGGTPVSVPGIRTDGREPDPTPQSVDPPDPGIMPPLETPLPVPEPSTLTLFGLAGAAGIAHQLRKRARTRARN